VPLNGVPDFPGGDARSAPGVITDCSSLGGNFGSTTGSTATIIEYNYKIISTSVSLRGYELGQLENAMIDAIIPSLFNSCARRKLEENPLHRQRHLEMAGLSAAPNDIVNNDDVEGSCQQQDSSNPNRNCATAVLGRMTIYTDGDDPDTLTTTIRDTICEKMDNDVFNGSYTSTTESETVDYTILKSECFTLPPAATKLETDVIVQPLNPTNFVIVGFAAVFAAFLIYAYGRWRTQKKLSSASRFNHLDDSDLSDSSYDNDSLSSVCGPPAMDLRSIHDNRVVDDSPVRISTIARNSHFPETIQECWAEEDDCLEDSGEISRFGLGEDSLDDMETVLM